MKYDKTKPTVTVSNPKWDHILLLPLPHPLSPGWTWINSDKIVRWNPSEPAVNFTSGEIFISNSQMASFPNSTCPMCQPHFIDQFLLLSNLFYPLWVSVTSFSHLHVISFLYVVIFFFLFFLNGHQDNETQFKQITLYSNHMQIMVHAFVLGRWWR